MFILVGNVWATSQRTSVSAFPSYSPRLRTIFFLSRTTFVLASQHSPIHSPPLGTRCSACFFLQKLTLIHSLIYEMELNFACGERRDETPTVGSMRKWVRDNRTSGLLRPSQPLRRQNPRFASTGGSPFHRVVMRFSGSCRLPHGSEMRHTRNRCPEFLTTDFADPLMVLRVVHEERDRAII